MCLSWALAILNFNIVVAMCQQVMLDNEMILSMLRNVVAGLSFLHSAEPPIVHQELRSSKILLDSSCRAHLSDFQQNKVRLKA